jgi:CBS domain-containing protein
MILQDLFRGEDELVTARPEQTIGAVAAKMEKANVGAVIVVDPSRKVVGIVTDRDIALALGQEQATPQSPVNDIMTKDVVTIWEDEGVFNATQYLCGKKVRRLPVVDHSDRLVGMVTFDDLVAVLAREFSNVAQALEPALHEQV